jgi:hypothetical protein
MSTAAPDLLPLPHGQDHVTFGTTIRIARLHHPSCLSRKASDLPFR